MVCLREIISVGEQGWVAAHSKIRATHNHNHPHVPSQPAGISPVIALTLFSHGNTTGCLYFSWNCSEFLFKLSLPRIKAPTNTHTHPLANIFPVVHSDIRLQLRNTTLFLDCHYHKCLFSNNICFANKTLLLQLERKRRRKIVDKNWQPPFSGTFVGGNLLASPARQGKLPWGMVFTLYVLQTQSLGERYHCWSFFPLIGGVTESHWVVIQARKLQAKLDGCNPKLSPTYLITDGSEV